MVRDSNRTMSISPDGKVIRVFTLSPYTFAIEKSGRKANAIIRLNTDEYLKIISTSPKKIVIQHEQAIFTRTISDITLVEEILGMKLVNISWEQHTTEHTHTFENVDPNYTHSQCLEEEGEYRLITVSTRLLHELDEHKADLSYNQYIKNLLMFYTKPLHTVSREV